MPSYPHDAIIIVLDVGKSVSTLHSGEKKTFFEHSRGCISWIIQRKLISQSADVLAIVLIGSNDSKNALSTSGYKNICCKFDLQLASWDMLKFVECEVKTTEKPSDWIGALIVSMEMLKVYEEFNNVRNKKIVFFSDFTCPSSDNLDIIIKNLKSLKIDITIIGPESVSETMEDSQEDPAAKRRRVNNEKSIERQKGEELVYSFWKKLPEQIVHCTFEDALKQLCSYVRKACRKTPWNCILDIGNVKINVSMLKKTDPKTSKKFNMKYIKHSETDKGIGSLGSLSMTFSESCENAIPVMRDKVMHYKHDTMQGEEIDIEVTKNDTIEGYRYGTSVIPFSEEDKAIMEYKPGPKSFSVIGFTKISSVPFYLLSGEFSYVVVPGDKDENAAVALSALIQAMKKKELLAVVRKVYSDNRGLSLGILYPFIEEIVGNDDENGEDDETCYKECLIFIELAFEEEIKSLYFPPLESFDSQISEEQFQAVDDLIESMDLMEASSGLQGEPSEAFDLPNLHDFKEQFFHYCVVQRGLHPDRKLPTTLPSYIQKFMKVPECVEQKTRPVVHNLKTLFKIVKQKPENSTSETSQDDGSRPGSTELQSHQHFSESSLSEASCPFKRSLMKIFIKGFPTNDEFKSVLDEGEGRKGAERVNALKGFEEVFVKIRDQYLNKNPDFFNCWMYKLKALTNETNAFGKEIWNNVVSSKLGLISKKENKYSSVTEEDEENFFYEAVTQSPEYHTPKYRKPDFAPIPDDLSQFLVEAMDTDLPI